MFNFFTNHIHTSAKNKPAEVFLKEGDNNKVTYKEFYSSILSTISSLTNYGVRERDIVCLSLENSIGFYVYFFALLDIGAIVVPISSQLKTKRFNYIIKKSQAVFCITSDLGKKKSQIISRYDKYEISKTIKITSINSKKNDDSHSQLGNTQTALIIYTSGSTGTPTGVAISRENIIFSVEAILSYLKINNNDNILNVLPANFDYGLYQGLFAVVTSARMTIYPKIVFGEQLIEIIKSNSVTVLPLMPVLANMLLAAIPKNCNKLSDNTKKIRLITSTGDVLHPTLIQGLKTYFSKSEIFSMYGLTECKRVSFLSPKYIMSKPYCVGHPMRGVRAIVVDSMLNEVKRGTKGRLLVLGQNIALGYWGDPVLTDKHFIEYNGEKALLTNDIFIQDSNEDLYYVGRTDDIVKSGGYRISLKEVNSIIFSFSKVESCVTSAYEDEKFGVLLKCEIKPVAGEKDVISDLIGYLKLSVENRFLIPTRFELVSQINQSENYKIIPNEN